VCRQVSVVICALSHPLSVFVALVHDATNQLVPEN